MKIRARIYVLIVIGLVLAVVFIDSLGVFDNRPYFEVPHGSHTHYVPKDCEPPLRPSDAPTQKPRSNEMVDCQGRIVPLR